MAKNVYVGVGDVARKVSKLYVGVGDVARKITKGYVGVNGVAQQFYASVTAIPFTSSIAPTSWSGGTTTAGSTSSGTNTYGTWKVSMSVKASSLAKYAVDNDNTTYCIPSASATTYYLTLELPSGCYITPTEVKFTLYIYGSGAGVQGYDGSSWVTLATTGSAAVTKDTFTKTVTTTKQYSKFRVYAQRRTSSSNSVSIYDFKITKGTLYKY